MKRSGPAARFALQALRAIAALGFAGSVASCVAFLLHIGTKGVFDKVMVASTIDLIVIEGIAVLVAPLSTGTMFGFAHTAIDMSDLARRCPRWVQFALPPAVALVVLAIVGLFLFPSRVAANLPAWLAALAMAFNVFAFAIFTAVLAPPRSGRGVGKKLPVTAWLMPWRRAE